MLALRVLSFHRQSYIFIIVRARVAKTRSAPASAKKKPLTFTEKELKAVLLEEYEWQRAQVQDLLKRLEKRREG